MNTGYVRQLITKISNVEFKQAISRQTAIISIQGSFFRSVKSAYKYKQENESGDIRLTEDGWWSDHVFARLIAACFRWLNIRQNHARNDINF
jgi:hypothetical protein